MMTPARYSTLIDMLNRRAEEDPGRVAFDFAGEPCTFDRLWRQVGDVAAHLIEQGVKPGDRVIVTIPNSMEFFFAFYGVQRARAIAVPLFPGFGPERILSYAETSGAVAVIVPSSVPRAQLDTFATVAREHGLALTTPGAARPAPADTAFPAVMPDDVAFVQYTSGSTGAPKGVQISHDNLITNIRQMIAGMEITQTDIFVSWLPVYHDMGLILKTMVPLYLGLELYLLPSDLREINSWLSAIETHKATFTAAPDFAYRLCVRRVRDPNTFDLSSLRVALNAAEPVRPKTIEDFERAFALMNVMVAGYGLAEATVGVSMWPPNTARKVDAHGNVSVGKPFPDVEVVIVKGDDPARSGEVGEIAIRSTALPRGYLNNDDANRDLFLKPGWALSGDLGYVDGDGDLFIVGRKKNIIIQSGRNLNPPEIEAVVDQDRDIRYSAAVGIDRGRIEGEQVYVFAEVRDAGAKSDADLEDIVIRIVQAMHHDLGFRPGRVFLLRAKSIPITYNGKFQHARLKQLFLKGDLDDKILCPRF